MSSRAGQTSSIRRIEWAVCIGATLAVVFLHLVYLTHAGALWRDEAGIVRLATLPQPRETLQMLTHDHSPVLFPAMLRAWSAAGPGRTDFGLRCLRFVVGLLVLGALWLNARVLGCSLPLLSLALLGGNLTFIQRGDSLRAYGLGCALNLLAVAAVWRLARKPSFARWMVAAIVSVLSVQCLYQNAFLLFAICCAACVVCWRTGQRKSLPAVLGAGAVAAISLLPYVGPIRSAQSWWMVSEIGFRPDVIWLNLSEALGSPMSWQILVWLGLTAAAIARGVFLVKMSKRGASEASTSGLFAPIALLLSVLLFFTFVFLSRLPTQPWYWLPLMVPAAVYIDAATAEWLMRRRVLRLILAVLIIGIPYFSCLKSLTSRQTNMDVIAAELGKEAKPDDLILVYPWYYGVSFDYYYRGAAPWTSLPAISDFRFYRYDLLKEKLAATTPINDALDRIAHTLGSGHRVWLVGELPPPGRGEIQPPELPPAPNGPYGWLDDPYNYVWGRQAEHFITTHGGRAQMVPLYLQGLVNDYENVPLIVVEGWSQPSP